MTNTIITKQTHICPRRAEIGDHSIFKYPTTDSWNVGSSLAPYHESPDFHSCSYCGSLHPDEFLYYLEQGWYLVPTDKNYKAYLGKPVEPPTTLLNNITIDHHDAGKFYFQHLNPDQRDRFINIYNDRKCKVAYPGYLYTLPYFVARRKSDG